MNEHSFIAKIHRKLPPEVERWKINDTNKIGVADCYYDGPQHGALFVEYKWMAALPKRDTTVVRDLGVSPAQARWLKERHTRGVQVAVILGGVDYAVIFPGDTWEALYTAGELRTMSGTHDRVVRWIAQHTGAPHGEASVTTRRVPRSSGGGTVPGAVSRFFNHEVR